MSSELPINERIDTETPVDHALVIQALLRDIEHHASQIDTTVKMRTMFGCGIVALEDMLEVMG